MDSRARRRYHPCIVPTHLRFSRTLHVCTDLLMLSHLRVFARSPIFARLVRPSMHDPSAQPVCAVAFFVRPFAFLAPRCGLYLFVLPRSTLPSFLMSFVLPCIIRTICLTYFTVNIWAYCGEKLLISLLRDYTELHAPLWRIIFHTGSDADSGPAARADIKAIARYNLSH